MSAAVLSVGVLGYGGYHVLHKSQPREGGTETPAAAVVAQEETPQQTIARLNDEADKAIAESKQLRASRKTDAEIEREAQRQARESHDRIRWEVESKSTAPEE